jgi:hypothetical protein
MKNFVYILASVLFLTISAWVISRPTSNASATSAQEPPKQQQQKLLNLNIQQFDGSTAAFRAKQLRRHNKGIARAMKDAEKRGLREAFTQGTVVLGTDPAQNSETGLNRAKLIRPASFKSYSAQDTFSADGYEVSFFPYDDGDPNTWEGIIYRTGPDLDVDIRYAVINIQTEVPETVVDVYYPPDGGDPDPNGGSGLLMRNRSKPDQHSGGMSPACISATEDLANSPRGRKALLRAHPQGCSAGTHRCVGKEALGCCGSIPPLDNWAKCSIFGAAASALSCLGTGPGWGACFASRTAAAMFLCLKAA